MPGFARLKDDSCQSRQEAPSRLQNPFRTMGSDPEALLRSVPLFGNLPDEALAGLASHLRRRTFRRGTIIFHKDQTGDALYIVESGRVRIFLPGEGGEELTVDLAEPGEVVGELALLDGGPRSASIEAVEDTVVHTLGREEFRAQLASSPQMAAPLIELLSSRLRQVTEYAESLAFLDIQARTAKVLLQMAERYGVHKDGIEIDVDITQGDLAAMVGATRERVNRALAAFRSQGVLSLRGRRIVVIDADRLKQRIY